MNKPSNRKHSSTSKLSAYRKARRKKDKPIKESRRRNR
jgi:hypothetical protein